MSGYRADIEELSRQARRELAGFDPPADPPDERRALRYLREGFGPTLAVYLQARTGGPPVPFGTAEFDRLQGTLNEWLRLYAACYGADIDPDCTVRTAAEVFIDTHDLRDTAAVLTHVP